MSTFSRTRGLSTRAKRRNDRIASVAGFDSLDGTGADTEGAEIECLLVLNGTDPLRPSLVEVHAAEEFLAWPAYRLGVSLHRRRLDYYVFALLV